MDYENLHRHVSPEDLNVGSVLVFGNKINRDSYIITYEVSTGLYYLISLANFFLFDKWESKKLMYKDLVESRKNGYQLMEIIPSEKLELIRKDEEKY